MALDLITVGRISVDLYAQEAYQSFADPQTFRKSIGGSPTNVAVAAARLGLAAAGRTRVLLCLADRPALADQRLLGGAALVRRKRVSTCF